MKKPAHRAGFFIFAHHCARKRKAFVAKAAALGTRTPATEQYLSHEQINRRLGTESDCAVQVEPFMRGLSPSIAHALSYS